MFKKVHEIKKLEKNSHSVLIAISRAVQQCFSHAQMEHEKRVRKVLRPARHRYLRHFRDDRSNHLHWY